MKHDDPRAGSGLPAPDSASPRKRGSALDNVQGATELTTETVRGIDLGGQSQ
jgi:hypothetical protein